MAEAAKGVPQPETGETRPSSPSAYSIRAEVRRLKQAVEQSPTTVMITDLEGRIEYVNATFQALTGYTPEEVLGLSPNFLQSGLHPPAFFQELWQTLKEGRIWRGELRNRKKNGELYWEKATISPVLDEAGQPASFLAVKEDITEHKRVQEALVQSERRYQELVEHQGEGFGIVDANERFTFVNPAAELTFGVPPGTLTGRLLTDFLAEGALASLEEQTRLRKDGSRSTYELQIYRLDGAVRTLLVTATPRRDETGSVTGTFGVFRDITERKEMEQAMEGAKTAADAANQAKSAFLANMSHEIRTPLNAVLGFLHLLRETTLTLQQQDFLDKASLSAKDLLGIINDILDFSKIEAGRVKVEQLPFALKELVDNLEATLSGKAAEKGLALVVDLEPGLPAALQGDALRLGQILRNLGSNALKFTAEGEVRIAVRGQTLAEGGMRVDFQVSDTGIGMTAEEMSGLFQPFAQADDSTTRRFGGTGLGLAISRRLAELMGGAITVTSRAGAGSVFTLTVPLQVPESLPETAQPLRPVTSGRILEGASVLLVEDNPLNRQLATVVLQRAGAVVTLAMDGAQAVERVRTGEYDVVIMDLQMPVMSGYEATRQIRRIPRAEPLLIIALTADAVVEVRERVLAAGMDACLTKPIEPALLVRTLAGALRRVPEPAPEQPSAPPVVAARPDGAALAALTTSLRSALEADEATARQHFIQLEALVRGGALEEALAPLRRPLEGYDYPRALSLLERFLEAVRG
jgi:PAS domain S-box-containing protein